MFHHYFPSQGEGMKGRVEPLLRSFAYTISLSVNSQSPSPNPLPSRERGYILFSPPSMGREGIKYYSLSP
jgi:hypothetical protein